MHIRQRGPSDCGVAAIGMFTGRSYDEVWVAGRAVNAFDPKRGTNCCGRILEQLGFHWENLGRHPDHPAPNPHGRPFRSLTLLVWASGVLHPNVARHFLWGRPALLSIVSLNHGPDGRHLVFYDGERVADPQEGRRGKKFATSLDDVDIQEAWVWQEKGII
jgi:hypothetical protein